MGAIVSPVTGFPSSYYGNFRYNGTLLGGTTQLGDPNVVGMDEDYDACDLENWFLAMQSADGQVIVPSFHRPGIINFYPPQPDGLECHDAGGPVQVPEAATSG